MTRLELSVDALHEAVDWVSTTLAGAGYNGDVIVVDQPVAGWQCSVRFHIAQDRPSGALAARLEQALAPLHRAGLIGELHIEPVPDTAADVSTALHMPRRAGNRFVILAPDEDFDPAPSDVVLRINASRGFGSGLHPATQLSLELIEHYGVPGLNALDLGTGSGILSVALAKLGMRVLALDNDLIAVESARENVRRNDVQQQVVVAEGSLGAGAKLGHWMGGDRASTARVAAEHATFDLVVANILARVHVLLAPDYRHVLRTGDARTGTLICSGFTVEREVEIDVALREAGFEAIERRQAGEWVALVHRAR